MSRETGYRRSEERGEKEHHLLPQITKGMKIHKVKGGMHFIRPGTKSQSEIRKEHNIKLSALKSKMK